jgi:hypothetical protein
MEVGKPGAGSSLKPAASRPQCQGCGPQRASSNRSIGDPYDGVGEIAITCPHFRGYTFARTVKVAPKLKPDSPPLGRCCGCARARRDRHRSTGCRRTPLWVPRRLGLRGTGKGTKVKCFNC